jgi:hypothetical protein
MVSGSKPNFRCSSLSGAEVPKVFMAVMAAGAGEQSRVLSRKVAVRAHRRRPARCSKRPNYPTWFANYRGEGGVRGMIISRRPNMRRSTEKAPGPRSATAIAMTAINPIVSGSPIRFVRGGCSDEPPVTKVVTAIMAAAIGVSNPRTSSVPLVAKATPAIQFCHTTPVWSARNSAPWTRPAIPTVALKRSSPRPGGPLGKAENSRCRDRLLRTRCSSSSRLTPPIVIR